METNEFAKIGKLVETVITRYREVRKECGIPDDEWHSRSIERMAAPFIKGYFTLAVVGKVSSGKSTFINALLGCKNLLPTGHNQTTCGLTYIEYGETPEVTILFGDDHKLVIKDDVSRKIKKHVSIPEKYHDLPVNNIDDMIMGGFDFKKIWEVRKQLEEETLCPPIDTDLLKDYVGHREKKDIAIEVRMKYPFNEELKGWRVIDTPGIGAIGGIGTRTKQLLATQKEDGSREVDAIIFLQDGSQTLDQYDTKKFVKDTLYNFTKSDKDRLFYVITHSGSSHFLNYKESKMDFINKSYGNKIKVVTYADSLLYTFLNDFNNSDDSLDKYDDFVKYEGWSDAEWEDVMQILDTAKRQLKKRGDSFNHDTMLRILQEWAHFEVLRDKINNFAKNEKQETLRKLFDFIAGDYRGFKVQLNEYKKTVKGNIGSIDEKVKNVEKKRNEYNEQYQKADNLMTINRINKEFDFIDARLDNIKMYQSIEGVRTFITNLFDEVQEKERDFFEKIKKEFSGLLKDIDPFDISMDSIDFDAIEKEATDKSKETYVLTPPEVKTHFCKEPTTIPGLYDTRTNPEIKLREFKALVLQRARSQRDKFLPQVYEKMGNMRTLIYDKIYKKIEGEKARLEDLKSQLDIKEKFNAETDACIENIHAASKELIKLAQDYGFKL